MRKNGGTAQQGNVSKRIAPTPGQFLLPFLGKIWYDNRRLTKKEFTMQTITEILAAELGQKREYVENVVALMDEGNTIPFIARYRKEMHGAI